MKRCALFLLAGGLLMISGCSEDCNCPVCPEQAKQIVTVTISGSFSDSLYGVLPPETFPFPELKNGSFAGVFSYDLLVRYDGCNVVRSWFPYEHVDIEIRSATAESLHGITTGGLHGISVWHDRQKIGFFFGPSAGQPLVPGDLRLYFTPYLGAFEPGAPPDSASLEMAVLDEAFLEVDDETGSFWQLAVDQVSIESILVE